MKICYELWIVKPNGCTFPHGIYDSLTEVLSEADVIWGRGGYVHDSIEIRSPGLDGYAIGIIMKREHAPVTEEPNENTSISN